MENKIIKIVTVTHQYVKIVEVGRNGVFEIVDKSLIWEDGIDFIFKVYGAEGVLLESIINCPVDVFYG